MLHSFLSFISKRWNARDPAKWLDDKAKDLSREVQQKVDAAFVRELSLLFSDARIADIAAETVPPVPTLSEVEAADKKGVYADAFGEMRDRKKRFPTEDVVPALWPETSSGKPELLSLDRLTSRALESHPFEVTAEMSQDAVAVIEDFQSHAKERFADKTLSEDARKALGDRLDRHIVSLRAIAPSEKPRESYQKELGQAERVLGDKIRETALQRMKDFAELFNEGPGRTIENRHRISIVAPAETRRVLQGGQAVRYEEWPEAYLNSAQHYQSQLLNGIDLMVSSGGKLVYRVAGPDDAGPLRFQRNWYHVRPSKRLRHLRDTADPHELARRGAVKRFDFIDFIEVPEWQRNDTPRAISVDMSPGGEHIENALSDFLSDEKKCGRIPPNLKLHPVCKALTAWADCGLVDIDARLAPDGWVAITVRVAWEGHPASLQTSLARTAALCLFSLMAELMDASGARILPCRTAATDKETLLRIPQACIWPLQVSYPRKYERARRVEMMLKHRQTLRPDPGVQRKHLGWQPLSEGHASLDVALRARFVGHAERVVHRLTHPIDLSHYGTLTQEDILKKLTGLQTLTSVIVCLLWLALMGLSLVQEDLGVTLTEQELWAGALLFAILAVWRCLAVLGLSTSLDSARETAGKGKRPEKLRFMPSIRDFVDIAFHRPWMLWTGPALMAGLILISTIDDPRTDGVPETPQAQAAIALAGMMPFVGASAAQDPEDGGFAWQRAGSERDPAAYSYSGALKKAVWLLPIGALGLLHVTYNIGNKLVAARSLAVSKLSILAAERTVLHLAMAGPGRADVGADPPGRRAEIAGERLDRVFKGLEVERDRFKEAFNSQSTWNAATVALIALLKPVSGLAPEAIHPPDVLDPTILAEVRQETGAVCDMPDELVRRINEKTALGEIYLQVALMDCLKAHQTQSRQEVEIQLAEARDALERSMTIERAWLTRIMAEDSHAIRSALVMSRKDVRDHLVSLTGQVARVADLHACVDPDEDGCLSALTRAQATVLKDVAASLSDINSALQKLADQPHEIIPRLGTEDLVADVERALETLEKLPTTHGVTLRVREILFPDTFPSLELSKNKHIIFNILSEILPDRPTRFGIGGLSACTYLGEHRFGSGSASIAENAWRFQEMKYNDFSDMLEASNWSEQVAADDVQKQIVVLGTADGQGPVGYNFVLAEDRAQAVADHVVTEFDFPVLTLSAGEMGWLAGLGLPLAEEEGARRAAIVLGCDVPRNALRVFAEHVHLAAKEPAQTDEKVLSDDIVLGGN